MVVAPQALRRIRREERDREVIQRAAELLTSRLTLEDLFHGICNLLARFIDGPTIFIALRDGEGARYAFMLENEVAGPLGNRRIRPGGCADRVLSTGQPLLKRTIADWTEGRHALNLPGQPKGVGSVSAMFVPLKFGSDVIGVLSVQSPRQNAYDESDLSLLCACALYLSVRIHQAQIESQSARLADIASTDSLTGVRNRRSFAHALDVEWRRALRRDETLSVILIDVDFFKTFNDTYGHVAGDAALQQVAQALAGCVTRAEDTFARYGGEEFIALLPGTPQSGAVTVAERMCEAISSLGIRHTGSALGNLTISAGVASIVPHRDTDSQLLLSNADAALYDAKAAGRNCVAAENYRSQVRAATAINVHAPILPSLHGSFFGEGADIELTCNVLNSARLVTVTGVAGCGKSRHALEVATRESPAYPDGVFYIDCATITEDRYLSKKIAAAIGVAETAMVTADSALALFLQTKKALIVVDNCDNMSGRVGEYVRAMLAQSRHVRILATCTTPLDVPSEVCIRVHPLELASAVDMLLERASAGYTHTQVATFERSQIEELCRRLQGLPREIELAAVHVRRLGPDELLRALPGGGDFLEWNYAALSSDEQRFLRRLSVFVGGAPGDAALRSGDARTLGELRERALLVQQQTLSGERYFVPTAIREIAVRQAIELGDWDEWCMQHARYFCERAEAIHAESDLTHAQHLCNALLAESDNIRAALAFTITDAADLSLGATLVHRLVRYWNFTGQPSEGLEWADSLLSAGPGSFSEIERADVLYSFAALDAVRTSAAYERALQAADLYRELHEERGVCLALVEAVFICDAVGKLDEALTLSAQAYAIAERLGEVSCMARALSGAGLAEHYRLNTDGATSNLERSLELNRSLGYDRAAANQLGNLGDVAATCGDYDRAVELTRQALAIQERLSDKVTTGWLLINLGSFECKRGNMDAARPALRRGLQIAQDCQLNSLTAWAINYLGLVAFADKDFSVALHLAGYADAMLDAIGLPRQPSDRVDYETLIERSTAALGAQKTADELQAGRSATRKDILAEALQA